MRKRKFDLRTKELGLTEKELGQYSVMRAVTSLQNPSGEKAHFERDLSDQICKRDNRDSRGIIIPQEVLDHPYASYVPRSGHIMTDQVVRGERPPNNRREAMVHRGMVSGVNASGGYLVDTELRSLIEVLVENTLALQNCPVLNAEGSPVNIPAQVSRVNIQTTREAPIKLAATTFSAAANQSSVDGLANPAFALITDASKKYLAFKSPNASQVEKLRLLVAGDTIGVGEISFTIQGVYDESNHRIEVNSDAVSTGLNAGNRYALEAPNDVENSDIQFGQVPFEPKFLRARVHLSRTLNLLSSTDMEMFTRNDLAIGVAKAMDTAVLYGTGTTNQPRGVLNTPGINRITWDQNNAYLQVIQARRAIAQRNIPTANLKWIMSWYFPNEFKTIKRLGAQTRRPIMGEDGMVAGAPVEVTSQITNQAEAILGNWSESAIALWQDLEIEVDTSSLLHQGMNRLVAFLTMDFNLLRPGAFVRLGA